MFHSWHSAVWVKKVVISSLSFPEKLDPAELLIKGLYRKDMDSKRTGVTEINFNSIKLICGSYKPNSRHSGLRMKLEKQRNTSWT